MDKLAKELTMEMIPDGIYRKIAETIGVGNLIRLSEIVGGTTFYLPKSESFLRPVRDQKIRNEFNGFNHGELALRYNVTERWVRQLCGEGFVEGQLDFEELMNGS